MNLNGNRTSYLFLSVFILSFLSVFIINTDKKIFIVKKTETLFRMFLQSSAAQHAAPPHRQILFIPPVGTVCEDCILL